MISLRGNKIYPFWVAVLFALGCGDGSKGKSNPEDTASLGDDTGPEGDADSDGDGDGDTDADTDEDGDTDADTDADGDTDSNTDTGGDKATDTDTDTASATGAEDTGEETDDDGGPDGGTDTSTGSAGDNPPEPDEPNDDLGDGPPPSAGACREQGLDELCRRRDLAPVKPSDAVIDENGWSQPESVVFQDTTTGVEVMRVTDDPAGSMTHCHINRTTYNANGSYLGFGSRRCWSPYWCPDNYRYIVAPGQRGPHIISVPEEHMLAIGRHETWDVGNPDVMYFVNQGENSGFFRARVSDGEFITERVVELPSPERRKHIYTNPAPDGTVAVKDNPVEGQPMNVYVWSPDSPADLVTFDLNLGFVHPDHSRDEEWHVHDFTFRRNAENSLVLNYGPEGSNGEPLFIEVASDGSQGFRVSYANNTDVHCPAPYYSHPAWSRDGAYVVYAGTEHKYVDGANPDGTPRWVWDDHLWGAYIHQVSPFSSEDEYATSTLVAQVAELSQALGHFAWDGFDERWIHGVTSGQDFPEFPLYRMASDGTRTEPMVTTYAQTSCDDEDCDYCSLPRPAQSPDATKVVYHSDMLQAEMNIEDIYIAVHRYPFAPVWIGLASADALRLRFRLHDLGQEIQGVRWLRSEDSPTPVWTDVAGVIETESFLDPTALDDGESALYAATAVEFSGLESRSLSRVIRVTRSGSTLRAELVTPYGTRDFDNEPPEPPAGLDASSPADGQIRLIWTAPDSPDLRMFHVYASIEGPPETTQAHRVASLPAGHPQWLDWSFGVAAQVDYAVTAVDYQGNESAPVRTSIQP